MDFKQSRSTLSLDKVYMVTHVFCMSQLRPVQIEQLSDYINCRQTSNIRRKLVGSNIGDHSDVVGARPVGAAPTASSFST